MIREAIVTTLDAAGAPYMAPMGVRSEAGLYLIAPFRPSRTLDNVLRSGQAVINYTDDVRIFAGFHTGRRRWPTVPAETVHGVRLARALAHVEVEVARWEDDELRPHIHCRELACATHAPFRGFNRAQAAVIEAGILASRLRRLPAGEGRPRDGLPAHRGGEDRRPPRARGVAVAGGADRGIWT